MLFAEGLEAEIEHVGHIHQDEVYLPVPSVYGLTAAQGLVKVRIGEAVMNRCHENKALFHLVDIAIVESIPVGSRVVEELIELGRAFGDLIRVGDRLEPEHGPSLVDLHVAALRGRELGDLGPHVVAPGVMFLYGRHAQRADGIGLVEIIPEPEDILILGEPQGSQA